MDLNKFKTLVEKWISGQNVRLSGVALLHDGRKETWSASLIVDGDGSWPEPSVENIPIAKRLCEGGNAISSEFVFDTLHYVQFIMTPDTRAKRWQAQWSFRGYNY